MILERVMCDGLHSRSFGCDLRIAAPGVEQVVVSGLHVGNCGSRCWQQHLLFEFIPAEFAQGVFLLYKVGFLPRTL